MKATVQGIIAGVPADQLRFDGRTFALCRRLHRERPVYGCPVCFVTLVHCQPLVDFAEAFCRTLVARKGELGPDLGDKVEKVLGEFTALEAKLLEHVVSEGGAA